MIHGVQCIYYYGVSSGDSGDPHICRAHLCPHRAWTTVCGRDEHGLSEDMDGCVVCVVGFCDPTHFSPIWKPYMVVGGGLVL